MGMEFKPGMDSRKDTIIILKEVPIKASELLEYFTY